MDFDECIRLIGCFLFNNGLIGISKGFVRRNLTRSSMDRDGGASLISIGRDFNGFGVDLTDFPGFLFDTVVFFFIGIFLLFPEVLVIGIDELFSLSLELRSIDTVRLVDLLLSKIKKNKTN